MIGRIDIPLLYLAAPILAVTAASAAAQEAVAPSGVTMELHETLYEEQPFSGELWTVLRVLAPGVADSSADPQEDLDWLCAEWGVAAARNAPEPPAQVVVQVMDRIVPRGETAPDATQFFAGYVIENDTCIWEGF
ncbi:DUF6497 family protein [Boseongicola sp. H5]|uniref:DUF6497 family protein n=1 Tax=Boseongicola sp. H5 TaxID=2763261 RepID=UPI001D0A07EA|nr:DUF6497 family protein [Boseongicola sp. H5]